MHPDDMDTELQAWNNGTGVSLETWIACEGNLKLAVGYTTVFWPRFKVLEDYIVREHVTLDNVRAFEKRCRGPKSGVEAVLNHLHIADVHACGEPQLTADRIRFLMPILKEIYEAKLAWQFPMRPCVVSLNYPEDKQSLVDYQITFWQRKHEDA